MMQLGRTVTRKKLTLELKKLRLDRALSVDHVANEMEWSNSKLTRIENGQVGISKADLTALLALYEVDDAGYVSELQELARTSRQRTWWSQYQRFLSASFSAFIGAEYDATRAFYFQPSIVPGLMQTKEYARAINAATAIGEVSVEAENARFEVRFRRQRELLQPSRETPEIAAVLDEAVLRRRVGGEEVMRGQLDRLIELAESKTVAITVLPFVAGAHLGMLGPFTLLEYADHPDSDVVYLENAAGGLILRDEKEAVDAYRAAAEQVRRLGQSDRAAITFIRAVRRELG